MAVFVKKRDDIDGLRTIAVLPVLLYHAGLAGFGGGFVGVDVFFVISGFLITKIIADEISGDRFSILNFYNRRIRRIFPALFTVTAATAIMVLFVLGPSEVEEFGRSVVYIVFMAANIFYWRESGYFDTDAESKPMLHTWSLGVEEQFYVAFPIILLVSRRWLRSWPLLTWTGLVGSLAASIYGVRFYADATFYLLPTRAWELLAGSVLALGAVPVVRSFALRQALATVGLLGIVIPVLTYRSGMPFPGETAIPPVLGAALIIATGIHGGRPTWVAGLLSLRPVVFIGLISYSLYLWHWPVVVFARLLLGDFPALGQTTVIVVLSFALATLSWRFVEQPFRQPVPKRSQWLVRARPVMAGVAVSVVFGAAGLLASDLFRDRGFIASYYSPKVAELNELAQKTATGSACLRKVGAAVRDPQCALGDDLAKPSIALVGDSTADALWRAMDDVFSSQGEAALRYIYHSCAFILGATRNEPERLGAGFAATCSAYVDSVIAEIVADPAIEFVILQSAYSIYFAPKDGALPVLMHNRPDTTRQELIDATVATARHLADAGKTVILIGAIPGNVAEFGAAELLGHLVRSGTMPGKGVIPAAACLPAFVDINAALQAAQSDHILYLDAAAHFVDDPSNPSECLLVRDGLPVTSDGTHVSAFVADAIARQAEDMIVAHSD